MAMDGISKGNYTIEAEIVWAAGTIKYLNRNLSRELIWS